MISFIEAGRIVLAHAKEAEVEIIPLNEALHRVLREDIISDRPVPPFDRVAMDGIAVFLKDSEINEGIWQIAGVVKAGAEAGALPEGQAYEIMTGASLPDGANTIIKIEDLEMSDGKAILKEGLSVKPGQNIHFKGMDVGEGLVIIPKYSEINAGVIAVAAGMGYDKLKVSRRKKVGIISSGGEIVDVNIQPKPYQIRRSNDIMAGGILQGFCSEINYYTTKDDFDTIRNTIELCLSDNDICITIGGISKGKFDYIPDVLKEMGAESFFSKVKQKPGKPFIFSKREEKYIFSLPGNPASAFVCAYVYVLPFLKKQLGCPNASPYALLSEELHNNSSLHKIVEMKVNYQAGQLRVESIKTNGSGDLRGLAFAQALGILEPEKSYLKGTQIKIILLK